MRFHRAEPRSGRPRRSDRPIAAAAATAAVALLAAACGSADQVTDAADGVAGTGEAAAETAAPDGPVLDAALLTGEAMTVTGETFDLGGLADKDLVLWFWAPW